MKPSHIAILGRQPELGLIELESLLGSEAVTAFGATALFNGELDIDRLGGSIKLARIIARQQLVSLDRLEVPFDQLPAARGKLTFAVSYYGPRIDHRTLQAFGLSLKTSLKAAGSVRYVAPKPGSTDMTAAQLKFNDLPRKGFELIIAVHRSELILALTTGVQDIDAYAERDHGRPARDAKVGMLPPKLAQILVNTTHAPAVFDPFCGTGVVLQEALLSGLQIGGSDLVAEMVAATQTNLEWLTEQFATPLFDWTVSKADARKVILPDGVSIVSEGYLGPNLTRSPRADELDVLIAPLIELYTASLRNFATQLPSGAEVTICAPAWLVDGRWYPLPLIDHLADLGYTMKVFKALSSPPAVYGRTGQAVGRALYLLTKV